MEKKITRITEKHFDEPPASVEKTAEGLMHETYTVNIHETEYIIQFSGDDYENHSALNHCLKMYELLKDSKIPVPRVMTEKVQEIDGREYTIVEKLPGSNMEQNVSREKVRQAGKILAKIHSYQSFEHEGHISFEDSEMKVHRFEEGSLKQQKLNELDEKLKILRDNDLKDLADKLEEIIQENIDEAYPKNFQPVLCHDDYSPDNTIWKNGEITGIIDFDFTFSGLPERNLVKSANTFWMHDPGAEWDIRRTFYEAYREEREISDNFEEMEKYFRVETLMWLVAGLIDMGEVNEEQKEFYREKINQTVQQ